VQYNLIVLNVPLNPSQVTLQLTQDCCLLLSLKFFIVVYYAMKSSMNTYK